MFILEWKQIKRFKNAAGLLNQALICLNHLLEVKVMNKNASLGILALAVLMSAIPALAVNSVLVPEVQSIEPNDVEVVQYCVSHDGNPLAGIAIAVERVCKDHNGVIGCQVPPDEEPTAELSVVALDAVTGADGCGDVQLTSNSASGIFHYTVSGSSGNAEITRETGTALVPEFTTGLMALTLAAAGLLVWRKRS